MKHITLLLAFFAFTTAQAQVNGITPDMLNETYSHQLDSMAVEAFYDKNYEQALQFKLRQTEIVRQMKGEKDKEYIRCLGFLPRLYYRTDQLDKAIDTAQETVMLWGSLFSSTDDNYAFFLDNLALYQANAGQNKAALENAKKALQVYEGLLRNDADMASILLHCAEYSWANGKMDDAVKYELRSLAITKELYGELSDQYLDELPFLQRYYTDGGDTDNAKKTEARINELKEKKKNRFNIDDLNTAEGCRMHNAEAMLCAAYYLDHPANDPQIPAIEQYISKWAIGSPDINIVVGDDITRLLVADADKAAPYISAFVAANIVYALKHKVKDIDEEGQKWVKWRLVNYYVANRDIVGRIPLLEQYVDQ